MNPLNIPEHFIPRKREIKQISNGFLKSNTVLLTGVAGIGKTTLARYYEVSNPLKFKEVNFFRGFEFDFDESKFALLSIKPTQSNDRLIIIDGFDEIFYNETKDRIIRLVREGRKYGIKLLITSRPGVIDKALHSNSYQVNLSGWDKKQVLDFLENNFRRRKLNSNFIKEFQEVAMNFDNNPLLIRLATELLQRDDITPRDLINLQNNKLHYKNEIIEPFTKGQIILPTTPKIITDVRLINTSIIDKVNRNPKMIYEMSSRQFEELVAELFDKEGYNVTITQATRDGGKDLLIIEQKRIGNFIIYVECKNYAMENPVGVRLVRELYGTVMADKATAGVLVTSSYFSKPALEFEEKVKSQLSLHDYYDLKKWIDEKANT